MPAANETSETNQPTHLLGPGGVRRVVDGHGPDPGVLRDPLLHVVHGRLAALLPLRHVLGIVRVKKFRHLVLPQHLAPVVADVEDLAHGTVKEAQVLPQAPGDERLAARRKAHHDDAELVTARAGSRVWRRQHQLRGWVVHARLQLGKVNARAGFEQSRNKGTDFVTATRTRLRRRRWCSSTFCG